MNNKKHTANDTYNLGLACDYTLKNFWRTLDREKVTVAEAKQLYIDFLNSNSSAINESIENSLGGYNNMLNEGFLDKAEQKLKSDDVIPDPEEDDDVDEDAVDNDVRNADLAAKQAKWHVFNSKNYRNPDSRFDINFYTDCLYESLMAGKFKEEGWKNTDELLPFSLYDTSDVTDFTAVMAFKDLPNVNLSLWDMQKAQHLDGLFYKSTFNNDSIAGWSFGKVETLKNMFVGCDMRDSACIKKWKSQVPGNLPFLPELGKTSADDAEEAMQDVVYDVTGPGGLRDKMNTLKNISRKDVMYDKSMNYFKENKKHRVLSSSEFINENFGDTIRSIGSKIKNAASKFMLKLKDGFTIFVDRSMLFLKANAPENIVKYIKGGNVQGVYAEIGKAPAYSGNGKGYYDEIKKGSQEYNNFIDFCNAISKYGAKNEALLLDYDGNIINEAKVGLPAKELDSSGNEFVNIDAVDFNTEQLKRRIQKNIDFVNKFHTHPASALIVFGAPGIGKTSIPKAMIGDINEKLTSAKDKMAVIVVDCSDMRAGDLTMPMPASEEFVTELKKGNPRIAEMMKELGLKDEDIKTLSFKHSTEAPKSILPLFEPSTGKKHKLMDDIANGCTNPIYDEFGNITDYEETGNGGILLFDEFLRADHDCLMGIAQLMMERKFTDNYQLGSKWIVMGCSNRPTDDDKIQSVWNKLSIANKERYVAVNFVPKFSEWREWAETKGHFDAPTLDFIGGTDPDGPDSRWHNVDPAASKGKNKIRQVTPRRWTQMVKALRQECMVDDIKDFNYLKLGKDFEDIVRMYIPDDVADEYILSYKAYGSNSIKYTWDYILAHPDEKMDKNGSDNMTSTSMVNYLTAYVRNHFSNKKLPKPSDFEKVMDFLDLNYPTAVNVVGLFIARVYRYCDILNMDKNNPAFKKYVDIWKKYDSAHPNANIESIYDNLNQNALFDLIK